MAFEIDLSGLLDGSDAALFRGAREAIDYAVWRVSNATGREVSLASLPESHQVVLRLSQFGGLLASDGLEAWIERDSDEHGPPMVAALELVGLPRAARALSEVYADFEAHDAWDVWDERMEFFAERSDDFARLEREICAEIDAVEDAGGRFVRSHAKAFSSQG